MIRRLLLSYADRFVSRWVVFIKDLLIVAFSIIAAYLLRFNFLLPVNFRDVLFQHTIFVVVLSAIAFLITRSYVGIIRHTSLQDVMNLVKAMVLVLVSIIIMNIVFQFFGFQQIHIIPYSVLLIFSMLSIVVLIFTRIGLKMFYLYMINQGVKTGNVIIFGAGRAGLIAKNALTTGLNKPNIVGFIDENASKIGKSIEGIPVYSPEDLNEALIKRKGVNEIIFAINNINPDRRNEIIEELILNNKIRVKVVPSVDKWINGEFSAKQIHPIHIKDLLERESIVIDDQKVIEDIRGKVIMVTGAAGSIGSELARQLCNLEPLKLVFLDQAETPLYELEQEIKLKFAHVYENCEFVIADVSNAECISRIFRQYKPHMVYHAAAYKHVPMMEINPFEAVRVNIFGTRLLADTAKANKVEKFVMISTDKAVNPTNVMGASKRAAEIYIQSLNSVMGNKTRFITTRFGNVLGSNGSVIPLFEKQIAMGGPVTVTHPDITRFFMTIPEACRLVFEAGAMGKGGEILLFDMGKPIKIKDLAIKMIRLSGFEPEKDIKIQFVGLRPGEKLYEELLNDKELSMPTHHSKIKIGRVRFYPYNEVAEMFSELSECVKSNDRMVIVAGLKRIVPEFISKNSEYENLDKDLNIKRTINIPQMTANQRS